MSTLAGSTATGMVDGTGTVAQFTNLQQIAVVTTGLITIYVTDSNKIRKITKSGNVFASMTI